MNDIVAIIVTYNRKEDLLRCVKAVMHQSHVPQHILIVDNASSDGTLEHLQANGMIDENCEPTEDDLVQAGTDEHCPIWYCRRSYNAGGAGGFHMGLKLAHERLNPSFFWLMDDDGYPTEECLELLLQKANECDYVMPISIDIEHHDRLAWSMRKRDRKKTEDYRELVDSWGEIVPFGTPFNGALLSKKCVSEVGYVDERFFLWGDEFDYSCRCKAKGIEPISITRAKFYHPSQKLPLVPILWGMFKVQYVDSPLRMICLIRNNTYVYLHYHQVYKIPLYFMLYTWLFLFTRKGDFRGWKLYLLSVYDGFRGDFTRHWKYTQDRKKDTDAR